MAESALGHGTERCRDGCGCRRHAHPGCAQGCACGKHAVRNSGQFRPGRGGRRMGGGSKAGWKGTADERFDAKVVVSPDGCHLWTGAGSSNGYGSFKVNGKVMLAHAYADERARGPLPPGLTRDHLCGIQRCVNVDHLERVSRAENTRREMARRIA